MRVRKYILISAFIIIFGLFSIFLFINIMVNKNIDNNLEVISIFNNLFPMENKIESLEFNSNLTNLEIDGKDYVGIINIYDNKLVLPVLDKCSNKFINIESACRYTNDGLVILGTNLNDSFSSYKLYDEGDHIIFTNMLGQNYEYKIDEIKRVNKINNISFDGDLVIIVKDYYNMEYILFISNFY